MEKWGSKPARGTVRVLGWRKAVAADGVDVVKRRMEHRPSVEQSASGEDGSDGCGPVNGEDGIGYEDAGLRLNLMVAKAGSRGGVGLGVVQPVFGGESRRNRAIRGHYLQVRLRPGVTFIPRQRPLDTLKVDFILVGANEIASVLPSGQRSTCPV